jgi:hypothetical protein
MFLTAFSRQSNAVFVQFASKLLGISIAQTGYIQSAKAIVLLAVLLTLIVFSQLIERRSSTRMIYWDLWVCRVSLVLLIAGCITLGFGKNIWIIVMGKHRSILSFYSIFPFTVTQEQLLHLLAMESTRSCKQFWPLL